jgi:enoyl-CoA hydratase
MPERVWYQLADEIATITVDDGKANALSPALQDEIRGALDRAEADGAVVLLTGRPGMFSAGFDLGVLAGGGQSAVDMVIGGFELAERLLSFPAPIVIACPGHAIAMGSFLLLAGDVRIGASGPYRIQANEVAIGMAMPRAALELMRQRLTPAALTRAAMLAEPFSPELATGAGFLDLVADPADLETSARRLATAAVALHRGAHVATKRRARAEMLAALRAAIDADRADLAALLA